MPKKILIKMSPDRDYTHTVLVEVITSQNCKPCHNWNQNIYDAYISGDYEFEYVEMIVYDHDGTVLNEKAHELKEKYNVNSYPTSIFDGDYRKLVGNYPTLLPIKLYTCGNRNVKDITADMTVSWLGDAKITINITIQNNEGIQYNGYIRAYITEVISRYTTYYNDSYHFGFLDYAFDKDISIPPGGVYMDTVTWDGYEHQDAHGDDFGDIISDNIQVIMGVFNENNDYVDETVKARIGSNIPPYPPGNPNPHDGGTGVDVDADLSWTCIDPDGDDIFYSVFFGDTSPPPKVASNLQDTTYDPGKMNHEKMYYWQIVAEDEHNATTTGPIWSFTTKKLNKVPKIEIIKPKNGLYIFNIKVLPRIFRFTKIIGPITIEVNATDEDSDIEKVEFYINGKFMGNDISDPYTFDWNWNRPRIFHLFMIKVIAYDYAGNTDVDRMLVRKIM